MDTKNVKFPHIDAVVAFAVSVYVSAAVGAVFATGLMEAMQSTAVVLDLVGIVLVLVGLHARAKKHKYSFFRNFWDEFLITAGLRIAVSRERAVHIERIEGGSEVFAPEIISGSEYLEDRLLRLERGQVAASKEIAELQRRLVSEIRRRVEIEAVLSRQRQIDLRTLDERVSSLEVGNIPMEWVGASLLLVSQILQAGFYIAQRMPLSKLQYTLLLSSSPIMLPLWPLVFFILLLTLTIALAWIAQNYRGRKAKQIIKGNDC